MQTGSVKYRVTGDVTVEHAGRQLSRRAVFDERAPSVDDSFRPIQSQMQPIIASSGSVS